MLRKPAASAPAGIRLPPGLSGGRQRVRIHQPPGATSQNETELPYGSIVALNEHCCCTTSCATAPRRKTQLLLIEPGLRFWLCQRHHHTWAAGPYFAAGAGMK
jgi:hypothetical protein